MSERSELHLLSKQGSATRTLRCKLTRRLLDRLLEALRLELLELAVRLAAVHLVEELAAELELAVV